jgi:hypothetical protein
MLMIFGALSVLSVGLMVFSTTELRIADNQRDHTAALYVAEAGISEVMNRMDLTPGTTVTVNGSTFDAFIGDDPLNPDPDWRTEVYLSAPGALPAPLGTETVVATVQPAANWLEYGDAGQGLEPIVIEHKWADLNGDGNRDPGELVLYDAARFPPENFATGLPIEIITVPAILNGSRRSVLSEVTFLPISIGVTAAIASDNGVDLTGNMAACGHNHDIATPTGVKIPQCRNFELCSNRTMDAAAGCLVAVMTTGDDANTGGSSDLEGFPVWSDTSSTNPFYDIEEYLGVTDQQWDQIRNNPDFSSANDAVNLEGIVIIEGDAVSTEKFNGNVGTGLIYVDGDMEIAGNFEWRGLIYVEGNCDITGTGWILGAIIVRGTTTNAFAAGNSTVLYSRDAIAAYVGSSVPRIQLGWKEI